MSKSKFVLLFLALEMSALYSAKKTETPTTDPPLQTGGNDTVSNTYELFLSSITSLIKNF